MSICLHVVLNSFKNDSRVLKETFSVSTFNFFKEVDIVALHEDNLLEQEAIDNKRKVFRIKLCSRKLPKNIFFQFFKYLEWSFKIFTKYINKEVKVVHCHDLSALPIGCLFKLLKRSKIIYDAHELEAERCNLKGFRKKMTKILEKALANFADKIITVSDSIAKWYIENYHCDDVCIIRNIPIEKEFLNKGKNWLKEKLNIKSNDMLFIYLGGFSIGRGIEKLLNVFSKINKDKHILFMGYGELECLIDSYKDKIFNIHRINVVPTSEVLKYTLCADAGVCFLDKLCLSYYFSLPNKVFEYLKSGIPIVINDFPDQRKLIDTYDCGWVVSEDENSIINFFNNIGIDSINSKRKGVASFNKENSWDIESIKLKKLYESIL